MAYAGGEYSFAVVSSSRSFGGSLSDPASPAVTSCDGGRDLR
jgi:hypothetical protein